MRPVTWIHTADLHLDAPLRGWKGSKEEAWRRQEDYIETFKRVISVVKQKKADFLLIAGDFIEHGFVQHATMRLIQEQFLKIPDTKILISPGNHDPYRPGSYYCLAQEWPSHVHIFKGDWESCCFEEYGLHICGRGFQDFAEREWVPPKREQKYPRNILLAHGTFFPHGSDASSGYFPIPSGELSPLKMDYVALGHIHKRQLFTLDNVCKTRVCYPGSPEALNWKETGARTVVYGTLDDRGMHLEWIPIHTRTYERLECDVTHFQTREQVLEGILPLLTPKESCFQIHLQGRRSLELDLELWIPWLQEKITSTGVYQVSLQDETVADFDLTHYRQDMGITGAFVRKMEERMKQYPEQQVEIQAALYKGLEALEGRRERVT